MFEIPAKNEFVTVTKMIIEREQLHNNCQQIEELTTHAFLSHKRSSAQGIYANGHHGDQFQELLEEFSRN